MRITILFLTIFTSACSTKMHVTGGGVPFRQIVPVKVSSTHVYEYRHGLTHAMRSKLGTLCRPITESEIKNMPWGAEERVSFSMPFLGRGKAGVSLHENGGLNSVSIDSDGTAVVGDASKLLAAALPVLAKLEAIKAITEPIDNVAGAATDTVNAPSAVANQFLRFNFQKAIEGDGATAFLNECLSDLTSKLNDPTVAKQLAIDRMKDAVSICGEQAKEVARHSRDIIRAQADFFEKQDMRTRESDREQAELDLFNKLDASKLREHFCVRSYTHVWVEPVPTAPLSDNKNVPPP